jgi:hypothetical protein
VCKLVEIEKKIIVIIIGIYKISTRVLLSKSPSKITWSSCARMTQTDPRKGMY